MEIRVVESYDAELGYDEDKYYEINSYKNMVVYAQKNKHKQGLDGITLDLDSLIEDLKKNRILIKSEFEDVKESDLDKHYDYFILPVDFVNDIIVQLGFEPLVSKVRTYNNKKVEYDNKIISDIEFENIIADENNKFHWLTKCKFDKADITAINYSSFFSFRSGIWQDGTWEFGHFIKSTWKKGTWKTGKFIQSTWETGTWTHGWFENSLWESGDWWYGEFKQSTWEKGTWEKGSFIEDSTWENGIWEDGVFANSTWLNGTWRNGIWLISNITKCDDINTFTPLHIKYLVNGQDSKKYSFDEIWNSIKLLKIIKTEYLEKNNDVYIGNQIITLKEIKKRIKELKTLNNA